MLYNRYVASYYDKIIARYILILFLQYMFLACLVLITYLGGQERLYCTHEALNIAYNNPSSFCQFSGMLRTWLATSIIIMRNSLLDKCTICELSN